ncbi:hypothetical protein [Mobilicoccus pelagius]|uniref:DUF7847 domain-containing protein n=1 Tax=Mobilicoccus pelagius NBRC 104925 TaxID=1089455 RepID=H5UU05_9MICO|nr:hypothetical protein [Mobilicoccus pelagius]GAB49213.1 hypothetical protein MOPEL_099_00130 [Mobilicoccus pelagius NBRC 104925]
MSRWDDPTGEFDDGWGGSSSSHGTGGGAGTGTNAGGPRPGEAPSGAAPSSPVPPSALPPGAVPPYPPADTPQPAPVPPTAPPADRLGSSGAQGAANVPGVYHRVAPDGTPELWPGPIPLRPMSFGEMFEIAFGVLRFNPRTIFGLSFLTLGAFALVGLAIAVPLIILASTAQPDVLGAGDNGASNSFNAGSSLAGSILGGIIVAVVADTALGRRLSFGEAWARVKGRILPLIGFIVLEGLLFLALVVPFAALWIALAVTENWWAFGVSLAVGIPVLIVLYTWLGVMFTFAPSAIVLEHTGPVAAFRRSRTLIRGAWWRTFGIIALTGILTSVVVATLMLPLGLGIGLLSAGGAVAGGGTMTATTILALVLLAAATVLTGSLVQPFSSAMVALLYLDRRFRTEALAVDLLAEAERDAGRLAPPR